MLGAFPEKQTAVRPGPVIERPVPDAGDPVRDRDTGQAGAVCERPPPILVTLLGIVTLVRLVPPEKLMMKFGIVTLIRLVQSSNAQSPMLVTPLGIITLVRLVQPANASSRC